MAANARLLLLFMISTVVSALSSVNLGQNRGSLVLKLDKHGSYHLGDGRSTWLASGDVYMTVKGKRYTTADHSLKLMEIKKENGRDRLGQWQSSTAVYRPADPQAAGYSMWASVYSYSGQPFLIFKQSFPEGVPVGSEKGDENMLCTGFPTFNLNATNASLAYHAFGGIMFGNTQMKTGRFGSNMTVRPVSGLDSGPVVLFDSGDKALILSSFSHFMAGSAVYTSAEAAWGLLGSAEQIPVGFEYSVISYTSAAGIHSAISGWGEVLRTYYSRHTHFRDSDFSNNYLGYYTDNGAYYYYMTEASKTYEQTIYDIKNYATSAKIPYRYIQYDSWWYPKAPEGGVTEWVSMPKIFPQGMQKAWNTTGWMSVAHNRWWSDKTGYAKQNGGKYNFIVEPTRRKALPMDQMFWDDLMRTSRLWGLFTYEQDWLNVQFDEMMVTVTNLEVGRTWLRQMGSAAARHGLTIQYCMSPSRHALQSLEIPVVSQARVSNDYLYIPDQWRIGISSHFAHAMGVAPFKDNFWTTSNQPDNPYNKTEPYPALQSVVATLSTGPVAPSDKIGLSNVSLIMRSCDSSGRLLKPDRPALAINDQFKMAAMGRPLGEIWTTYTSISGLTFGIVLAADLQNEYDLTPSKASFMPEFAESRVFAYNQPSKMMHFGDDQPLHLAHCGLSDFCLYHTTPVLTWLNQELLLIGEIDKWVPMSSQRVKAISVGSSDVVIDLEGAVSEKINFHLSYGGHMMVIRCQFGPDGTAQLRLSDKSCVSPVLS